MLMCGDMYSIIICQHSTDSTTYKHSHYTENIIRKKPKLCWLVMINISFLYLAYINSHRVFTQKLDRMANMPFYTFPSRTFPDMCQTSHFANLYLPHIPSASSIQSTSENVQNITKCSFKEFHKHQFYSVIERGKLVIFFYASRASFIKMKTEIKTQLHIQGGETAWAEQMLSSPSSAARSACLTCKQSWLEQLHVPLRPLIFTQQYILQL